MNTDLQLPEKKVHRYYKYHAINRWLIDLLVHNSWYFAKPEQLNDPFDCRIDLRMAITRAVRTASSESKKAYQRILDQDENRFLTNWEQKVSTVGICAFSRAKCQELLWAHYADNHRGVCLKYEFDNDIILAKENTFIGGGPITYENDALTRWLIDAPVGHRDEFLFGLIKRYLTIKAKAWRYEQEARFIRFDPGPFALPPSTLTQVVFGIRTPNSDVVLIKKLAKDYSNCESFYRVDQSNSDFGLTLRPLE